MCSAREVVFCGVVWLAFALTCCSGLSMYSGEACDQHGGRQGGTCTPLPKCPQYQDVIRSHGLSDALAAQLRALHCGYEGSTPLICCKSRQTDPPRSNPVEGTSGPHAEHRNLRLLPTNCGLTNDDDRIIHGFTANQSQFPWMVQLLYQGYEHGVTVSRHQCGGSLINERYVLTAAHCIKDAGDWILHEVVLGDIIKERKCETVCHGSIKMRIQRKYVKVHNGYSETEKKNDIALIRLPRRVHFKSYDNIQPICLPTTEELKNQNLTGVCGSLAGWGVIDADTGKLATLLQYAYLRVISTEECGKTFHFKKIDARQLCTSEIGPNEECAGAGDEWTKNHVHNMNACKGDSGGPFVYTDKVTFSSVPAVRQVQWGILSYNTYRCAANKPTVYTRVSSYMNWILDHIED